MGLGRRDDGGFRRSRVGDIETSTRHPDFGGDAFGELALRSHTATLALGLRAGARSRRPIRCATGDDGA